jgi:hypothetical protein
VGHSKGPAKGRFITLSAHIKKAGISQVNNLMMHQKQTKLRTRK